MYICVNLACNKLDNFVKIKQLKIDPWLIPYCSYIIILLHIFGQQIDLVSHN